MVAQIEPASYRVLQYDPQGHRMGAIGTLAAQLALIWGVLWTMGALQDRLLPPPLGMLTLILAIGAVILAPRRVIMEFPVSFSILGIFTIIISSVIWTIDPAATGASIRALIPAMIGIVIVGGLIVVGRVIGPIVGRGWPLLPHDPQIELAGLSKVDRRRVPDRDRHLPSKRLTLDQFDSPAWHLQPGEQPHLGGRPLRAPVVVVRTAEPVEHDAEILRRGRPHRWHDRGPRHLGLAVFGLVGRDVDRAGSGFFSWHTSGGEETQNDDQTHQKKLRR